MEQNNLTLRYKLERALNKIKEYQVYDKRRNALIKRLNNKIELLQNVVDTLKQEIHDFLTQGDSTAALTLKVNKLTERNKQLKQQIKAGSIIEQLGENFPADDYFKEYVRVLNEKLNLQAEHQALKRTMAAAKDLRDACIYANIDKANAESIIKNLDSKLDRLIEIQVEYTKEKVADKKVKNFFGKDLGNTIIDYRDSYPSREAAVNDFIVQHIGLRKEIVLEAWEKFKETFKS